MPSASLRVALLVCLGLFLATPAPIASGQEIESVYGPLPVFEFHSSFWVNLHHFLYHEARTRMAAKDAQQPSAAKPTGPVMKVSPGAQTTLSAAEQKLWDDAIAFYIQNEANKDMQINIDLILLKDQIGDFEDCDELTGRKKRTCDAGLPGRVGQVLESAAQVYKAHWWVDQDRSNRRWVARVAPLVREQGVGLSQRLAEIYQTKWPKDKIRVDVCGYANAGGAYTTLDPLRVTIASMDARNQGAAALEVLFHEASHGIAGPVESAIQRECRQRDKPIPRDLWHALIYYTTAQVIRPVIHDAGEKTPGDGTPGVNPKTYPVPYALRESLSQRGWEEYLKILAIYWQPYLDGKVNFEDSIAHLISAA
ncbi:MAG TPA: hypothetical protein VGF61_06385 [Candidatus Acidoferrum sp.]|jgi:hypothetical protein